MQCRDFAYTLPEHLIAQHPVPTRSESRLLCLDRDSGSVADHRFTDLPALLRAGDLLVFNDTRVVPARLFGRKDSGGRVEMLARAGLGHACGTGADPREQAATARYASWCSKARMAAAR